LGFFTEENCGWKCSITSAFAKKMLVLSSDWSHCTCVDGRDIELYVEYLLHCVLWNCHVWLFCYAYLWICRNQIKFPSSLWGVNSVGGCPQSFPCIYCMLCSLGYLRMAGKVFGPDCDNPEVVLGNIYVLCPDCCKCGQILDSCWPFQHMYASPFHQLWHLERTNGLVLDPLLKLKVGNIGILLILKVVRTRKPCIPFTDNIPKFFHQSTMFFTFTK
jgi:hypothetical protein